ncbi:MAG: iron-sulfur protein [Treponema sp.]|jgi:epoxyqueuosine reductase|nr:iron-sulfur protein [Treponema sp.]
MDTAALKAALCERVLDAGFVRVRILAPFDPSATPGVPEQYRAGAPSLLIAALPYGNMHEPLPFVAGVAVIAPFARRNYYREGVQRLQRLGSDVRSQYGGKKSDFRILCNSPVPEKPLALAAGLGVLGRNGLISTPEAGSLSIIAAMTLPFPLEGDGLEPGIRSDHPFPRCVGCDPVCPPCVAACPTKALPGDGTLDRKRCIQWYASGHGTEIPPVVVRNWGNRLYGCTECQDACIHNQGPIQGVASAEGPLPAYLDPLALLSLSDGELKARFKGTALGFSWLGPQGIRRNAHLAAGAASGNLPPH